jgi:flagellar hook-length control protein FliK
VQTVTPVIANAAPAGAAPDQGCGDKAAFPTTLRGAMAPHDGKASPPKDGKNVPRTVERASPAQAGASDEGSTPTAESSASTAVDPTATPTTSVAGSQPHAVASETPTESTPPEVPKVATALHDIAASRKLAQTNDAPVKVDPVPDEQTAPATEFKALKSAKAMADAALATDADQQMQAAPGAASAVPTPPVAPGATPVLPPTPPPGNPGNGNPVAAAATAHAREVVLDRPAATRAWGLLGKVPTDIAPADTAPAAADPALPASPAPSVNAGGDTASHAPTTASASPAPFTTATSPTPSVPDFAALGAPALVAAGGHAAPLPALADGRDAPASALPDLNIAAPPGSPQFGPEIGERVLWLVRDGLQEARLQLNPRELGPVEVRLAIGDGAAQVSFSTQHAGTAAAVQQSLPQLRDLLAQQGLQLGQATVSHQPAGDGQAAQQQAQGSGGQPGWERSRGADIDDGLPLPTARVVGQGLVDAYA